MASSPVDPTGEPLLDHLGTGDRKNRGSNGEGPSIWFHSVPEQKSIKNRIHIDGNASGGRDAPLHTRRERVEAQAARLVSLGATTCKRPSRRAWNHHAVALTDPEGNEFDIN